MQLLRGARAPQPHRLDSVTRVDPRNAVGETEAGGANRWPGRRGGDFPSLSPMMQLCKRRWFESTLFDVSLGRHLYGTRCPGEARNQKDGTAMARFHPRRPLGGSWKVAFYTALFSSLVLGDPAGAEPRCAWSTANSLRVADCQAQGRRAVPETEPSVQVLLLTFNAFSSVSSASFPPMVSLRTLSLGKQTTGSLAVGEKAFRNVSNLTFLDLGGNGKMTLHRDALWGLARLEVLLLDANSLTEAVLEGAYFRGLASLKRLDLSGNQIRRLRPDPSFRGLQALRVLQLRLNLVEGVCGDDLRPLGGRRLALLDLSSNRLPGDAACGAGGGPFRNLTLDTLDVSGNPWDARKAERFLASLEGAQVRHLRLRHSGAIGSGFGFRHLRDLSASTFSGLARAGVVSLDLSHGFLNRLVPGVFSGLPDLQILLLRSHEISRIQEGAFVGLGQLGALDLSDNLLGELYEEALASLRRSPLRSLALRSNHLGVVQPGALSGLDSLEHLDLGDNALSRVPAGKLPALRTLLLGQNRIRDAWGLERLGPNLARLDLSSNRLGDLGQLWAQLGHLPNLRFLNLSSNLLGSCYGVRNGPRRLQELDLSANQLGNIWAEQRCLDLFGDTPALSVLNLSANALRSVPGELFQDLASLEVLDLSSNRIPQLPDQALRSLRSLHTLRLRGNPLVTLSPAPFAELQGLRVLDLRELSLVCDCGLSDLQAWVDEKATVVSEGEGALSCVQAHPAFRWRSLPSFLDGQCPPSAAKASWLLGGQAEIV